VDSGANDSVRVSERAVAHVVRSGLTVGLGWGELGKRGFRRRSVSGVERRGQREA
jgi:hypothetical protein